MTSLSKLARSLAEEPRAVTLFGVPEGHDAATIGGLFAESGGDTWLHVCRDDGRMSRFAAALAFFHPELNVLSFPAWDCLPYDRVSPNGEITSRRIDTLTRLAAGSEQKPLVLLTTVNALLQRVPPRHLFEGRVLTLGPGGHIPLDRLQSFVSQSWIENSAPRNYTEQGRAYLKWYRASMIACWFAGAALILAVVARTL